MRRVLAAPIIAWLLLSTLPTPAAVSTEDAAVQAKSFAGPGLNAVQTANHDWTDDVRQRDVPVKIYYPKTGEGPLPVILFSHGLGGSREGYEYLGRHWAGHGYVSVHLQHKGSDTDVWKGKSNPLQALRQAAMNPTNSINRPADVKFAVGRLEKLNGEAGPLRGRLDLSRVGAAGHSFGAFTTLAVAGEVFALPLGKEISVVDPRIKAAIPMSAPVPHRKDQLDKAFGSIKIPCLHMTGTKDDSPIGETRKEDRRLPFDHAKGPDQYLIIFEGGDHMIFSGHNRRFGDGRKDPRFHELIRAASTAFWDAYLKGDAKAKAWLAEGGFKGLMDGDGTLEKKRDVAQPVEEGHSNSGIK
ncbi:MAG: hypothetical protein ABIK89_03680 [Planctomycetota bacterium]